MHPQPLILISKSPRTDDRLSPPSCRTANPTQIIIYLFTYRLFVEAGFGQNFLQPDPLPLWFMAVSSREGTNMRTISFYSIHSFVVPVVVIIISVVVVVVAAAASTGPVRTVSIVVDSLPDRSRMSWGVVSTVPHEVGIQYDDPQSTLALLNCVVATCENKQKEEMLKKTNSIYMSREIKATKYSINHPTTTYTPQHFYRNSPRSKVCRASEGSQVCHKSTRWRKFDDGPSSWPSTGNTNCDGKVRLKSSVMFCSNLWRWSSINRRVECERPSLEGR